jgi:hypothetical protein
MTRAYTTDAHFAQYTSPSRRRLSRAALAHEVATIDVIVFDIDCPEVHGSPEPAPAAWFADIHAKLIDLFHAHPKAFFYHTRGGCRVFYMQPVPVTISCPEDEAQWSTDYAITLAYLSRVFGIVGDKSCGDWTRLFRLPRVTREGELVELEMYGDPADIGPLAFTPAPEDIAAAAKVVRPRVAPPSGPAVVTDGRGALYRALSSRGDILAAKGDAYVIRCPREKHHSTGRTGDGSTLLYPPSGQHTLGAIHCLHSHCTGLDARSWRAEFTTSELKGA